MLKKPLVLVVDDDEDNVQLLEAALELRGFSVKAARSLAEAKAALDGAAIDVLVSDYSLGDGTAPELLESLDHGRTRPKVAVLVTGYSGEAHKERAQTAGFDAQLVKPYSLDELEQTIRQGLQR